MSTLVVGAGVAAVLLYFAAGAFAANSLRQTPTVAVGRAKAMVLPAIAVALHAAFLYATTIAGGLNLSLPHALSLVACVVALLLLVASWRQPLQTLGALIMPLAGLSLAAHIAAQLWRTTPTAVVQQPSGFMLFHIIVSILAYSLLSIAVVQSLMLSFQERQLHDKHRRGLLSALPPLQTMENLMFQMLGLGFGLLTLTLVSGVFFSEQIFGRPLAFTHHIVLSIIAWIAFAILLFGRVRFGWRGRHALRWTLAGFSLLVLAYFGSKFVYEIVIGV